MTSTTGTWYTRTFGTGGFLIDIDRPLFTNPPFHPMTPPPVSVQSCATCRYARPTRFDPFIACHRNAPGTGPSGGAEWPILDPAEWCGEWAETKP